MNFKIGFLILTVSLAGFRTWADATDLQTIDVIVNEGGFFPSIIQADPDVPVVLKVTRKIKNTCATSIEIPAKKIIRKLPINKTITIKLGTLMRGELKFGCAVSMKENGIIYVK